ncbi:hypothetical protein ACFSTD_03825 [Novosphingobium colocasiae]
MASRRAALSEPDRSRPARGRGHDRPDRGPSIADCLMILALPERIPGCTRLDTTLQPGGLAELPVPGARELDDALDEG